MAYKIAIAGAGQLGSRYLQGLALFDSPLEIIVFDISKESLDIAKQRFIECNNREHEVFYTTNIEQIPPILDMVIVVTTADVRPLIIKNINRLSNVKHWILEKIVAQNTLELLEIENTIGSKIPVWVNTPRYLMPLYKNFRENFTHSKPIKMNITGVNGLACNAIHYIDFVSRWNKSQVKNIDVSELEKKWKPAKRNGFYEVDGKMSITFDDGSQLVLTTNNLNPNYEVTIEIDHELWKVFETEGFAENNEGKKISGVFLLQSQITGPLLKIIFDNGICDLPTLNESIAQHIPFIESLITHWNQYMSTKISRLPIT